MRENLAEDKKRKRGERIMKKVGAKMMNKEAVHVLHTLRENHADAKQQARAERIMRRVSAKMLKGGQLRAVQAWHSQLREDELNTMRTALLTCLKKLRKAGVYILCRARRKLLRADELRVILDWHWRSTADVNQQLSLRILRRFIERLVKAELLHRLQLWYANYADWQIVKRAGVSMLLLARNWLLPASIRAHLLDVVLRWHQNLNMENRELFQRIADSTRASVLLSPLPTSPSPPPSRSLSPRRARSPSRKSGPRANKSSKPSQGEPVSLRSGQSAVSPYFKNRVETWLEPSNSRSPEGSSTLRSREHSVPRDALSPDALAEAYLEHRLNHRSTSRSPSHSPQSPGPQRHDPFHGTSASQKRSVSPSKASPGLSFVSARESENVHSALMSMRKSKVGLQ